jgi:cytochrome P450
MISFPLPILGNVFSIMKTKNSLTHYSQDPIVEWYNQMFDYKPPKIFMEFKNNEGAIVFNDPELVNDVYITKNKYFDKHPRGLDIMVRAIGTSILFSKSDELWAKKRKKLSAAFYKDKLTQMLQIIILQTLENTSTWVSKKGPINMC